MCWDKLSMCTNLPNLKFLGRTCFETSQNRRVMVILEFLKQWLQRWCNQMFKNSKSKKVESDLIIYFLRNILYFHIFPRIIYFLTHLPTDVKLNLWTVYFCIFFNRFTVYIPLTPYTRTIRNYFLLSHPV